MDMSNHTTHAEKTHKFSWGFFLVGVLFVLCSLLAFYDPAANLEAFAVFFAILAILNGVWLFISPITSGLRIVMGVIDVLIGIFMLFNIGFAMMALPYIFAIWFIADSVFRLINLPYTRALGNGYFWLSLVVNALGVVVGILLLFQPVTAALTFSFLVGFYLMMIGIESIIIAFSGKTQ